MKKYYYYRTILLACMDACALMVAMSFTYFFLYPKELFLLIDSRDVIQSATVFALLFITVAFLMKLYRVNWKYASVQEAMTLSLSWTQLNRLNSVSSSILGQVLERITLLSFCISLLYWSNPGRLTSAWESVNIGGICLTSSHDQVTKADVGHRGRTCRTGIGSSTLCITIP